MSALSSGALHPVRQPPAEMERFVTACHRGPELFGNLTLVCSIHAIRVACQYCDRGLKVTERKPAEIAGNLLGTSSVFGSDMNVKVIQI